MAAAKVREFGGNVMDQTDLILELVECDPAKRLEHAFEVTFERYGRWKENIVHGS